LLFIERFDTALAFRSIVFLKNQLTIKKTIMKGICFRPAGMFLSILFAGGLLLGCKKEKIENHDNHENHNNHDEIPGAMNSDEEFKKSHKHLHWFTVLELLQARWATAKYRSIQRAKDEGYADIDVRVENMGHHYMKLALVDGKFDIDKPEILVYNKNANGTFTLVAVEYAVPIELTPNKAPRGFTGNADVWDRNTTFGLWLLHAWVWYKNPEGVFNPTNPNVHTH
jgi:hypothetical protein